MPRVKRWLFNFAAGVSLIVFMAIVAVWVRSHHATDWNEWHGEFGRIDTLRIITGDGDCVIDCVALVNPPLIAPFNRPLPTGWRRITQPSYDLQGQWGRWSGDRHDLLGFIIWGGRKTGTINTTQSFVVLFPFWLVACVALVMPAAFVARHLCRRRRASDGRCAVCGYDLRATPDRCPECGTIPSADAEKGA